MLRSGTADRTPSAAAPTRWSGLLLGAGGLLVLLGLVSLGVGSRPIPLDQVIDALTGAAAPDVDTIVWDKRLPRALLGVLVGAALGLAGCVMQGLTRNPLADPGLLGVSAGSAFSIVLGAWLLQVTSQTGFVLLGVVGALGTSVLVYLLGSVGRGGSTPVKLAVAGIAVTFLLASLTSAVVLTNPQVLNRYRFWAAGSLAGQETPVLLQTLPFFLAGVLLAVLAAPGLNSVALGDDVAAGLGRRVGLLRAQGVASITLLTGAAVAVAGPIVFVGLVVPHAARLITGPDYRWLLPFAAVLGPALLIAADILARVLIRPDEVEIGVVVAFLGAPLFIALVRRRRLAEL